MLLGFLLLVILVAVAVYLTTRAVQRRRETRHLVDRAPSGCSARRRPDFLRDLGRKRKHRRTRVSPAEGSGAGSGKPAESGGNGPEEHNRGPCGTCGGGRAGSQKGRRVKRCGEDGCAGLGDRPTVRRRPGMLAGGRGCILSARPAETRGGTTAIVVPDRNHRPAGRNSSGAWRLAVTSAGRPGIRCCDVVEK